MTRKTVSRWLLVALIIGGGVVTYFWWFRAGPAPTFARQSGGTPFAQALAEPASFIYGSSIHLWVYRDSDGKIREVAVTGHADSPTCREMTARIFNTYLEKEDEPEDLFVAGAARLVQKQDKGLLEKLRTDPGVQAYRKAETDLLYSELRQRIVCASGTVSNNGASACSSAEKDVEEKQKSLSEMERKNGSVAAYLRQTRSGSAFGALIRELDPFLARNGLVEVHEVSSEVPDQVRQRLQAAVTSKRRTLVSFEDLLAKEPGSQTVVLVDMLQTKDGRPLSVSIPLKDLAMDRFDEASKANRDDVEHAMAGDARNRREFYLQKEQDTENQQERCRNLTPTQRRQTIRLTQTCTADGICVETKTPQVMTMSQYCNIQVPINLKIINSWISSVDELVKKIQEDRERKEGSRIERMNNATLIDSMLRDWRLPVARSQAAFDYWRLRRRRPTWALIRRALKDLNTDPEILSGEDMVFSVRVQGQQLEIHPVHVLDLARSVVIVDPAAGATRVVDAWSERSFQVADLARSAKDQARSMIDRAVSSCAQGNTAEARKALVQALSLDPAAGLMRLEETWTSMFRDDHANLTTLVAKVRPVISVSDHQALIQALAQDPRVKDRFQEYLRVFSELLKGDPDVPVDVHLKLAVDMGEAVAVYQSQLYKTGAPAQKAVDGWDVLEAYADAEPLPESTQGLFEAWRSDTTRNLKPGGFNEQRLGSLVDTLKGSPAMSAGDPYRAGRIALATEIMADPAAVIHEAIQTVKRRELPYFKLAESVRRIPDARSQEWRRMNEITSQPLSLFESEALAFERVRALMNRRACAESASIRLWSSEKPDLANVLKFLAEASKEEGTASNAALVSARERIEPAVNNRKELDTLARVQLASMVDLGSRQILLRVQHDAEDAQPLRGLRDHARLDARVEFDSIHYASALNSLFFPKSAVALYHPALKWQVLAGDSEDATAALVATVRGATVLVCSNPSRDDSACSLSLTGLSPGDANSLAEKINAVIGRDLPRTGKTSERVLMLQVALRPEAARLFELVSGRAERLALIKAMVYAEAPPARDLVPVANVPTSQSTTSWVAGAVKVPSLEETKQSAKARFKIE
jgi:tetratricopeptide (TPR) repeat protein